MILYPNKWILLPDGKRYQGEIDKATGLPHGLGMMALDATTFYAGEFSNGKRHGRGFLITLEVEEKERLCKASAEAKLAWTMPSVAENLKEKCQEKGAFIPKILAI